MPAVAARHPLTLDAAAPIAATLARREAHREADVDDLIQEGMFAYFTATKGSKTALVRQPSAFARIVMIRAMRGYYFRQREWQTRGEPNKDITFEAMTPAESFASLRVGVHGFAAGTGQAELLELGDYFAALERRHGATARWVAENLVAPRGDCALRILQQAAQKMDIQKAASKRPASERRSQPRGVKKSIRVMPGNVREAMGLRPTVWARTMEQIREFTSEWLGRPALLES